MEANKNIIVNADNTAAIFIDKNACDYRLKKAERSILTGEWCNSFTAIKSSPYKTLKGTTERTKAFLA